MKIITSLIFLLILNSCVRNNYNISESNSEYILYNNLPIEVQEFLNNPLKEEGYKKYSSEGLQIGVKSLVCLQCNDFDFEVVYSSFVKSWVDHYKITDNKNGYTYKIDYGFANKPIIIFKNKLYISLKRNVLFGSLDTENLVFSCYKLKKTSINK